MKLYRSIFTASVFMALTAGAGCGGTSDASISGKGVANVEIEPNKATLTTGTMLQFKAMAVYADGTSNDVTRDPSTVWNTSNPEIATVSKTGMVSALQEGLVDISADYKGEKANEHFAVTP